MEKLDTLGVIALIAVTLGWIACFKKIITDNERRLAASKLKDVKTVTYSSRANLLVLPIELRFMIYDIVKDLQIHQPLRLQSHRPQLPPRLPLRDLARSCKLEKTRQLIEFYPGYGEKAPQKQRLMEFTVEPWKPLLETR